MANYQTFPERLYWLHADDGVSVYGTLFDWSDIHEEDDPADGPVDVPTPWRLLGCMDGPPELPPELAAYWSDLTGRTKVVRHSAEHGGYVEVETDA